LSFGYEISFTTRLFFESDLQSIDSYLQLADFFFDYRQLFSKIINILGVSLNLDRNLRYGASSNAMVTITHRKQTFWSISPKFTFLHKVLTSLKYNLDRVISISLKTT